MSARPPWLADEPALQALLGLVLDRFDQQPASARRTAISLPAEKHLPQLARTDAAADQCWALVADLAHAGVLTIRAGRRGAYDAPWHGARLDFALDCEDRLRAWLNRAPTAPAMETWRHAVERHAAAFPGGCAPLLQRRIVIAGRDADEVVAAFASLGTQQGPLTLRQLSAYAFWGNSKVLDERGELVAALFPTLTIAERTIVVAVHLPPTPQGVLFIENQDTYTAATRGVPAAARDLALVYAAGFRSAAQRIRQRSGALLHYAGDAAARTDFEHWWLDEGLPAGPCHFWGDLDFPGLQILKSLRQRFGDVRAWQPGYAPLLTALHNTGGYRGAAADPQDLALTGCSYADEVLLPAIRTAGQIDQELPPAAAAPC